MYWFYSDEMIRFLSSAVKKGNTIKEIVALFNEQFNTTDTYNQIGYIIRKYGLRIEIKRKRPKIKWTPEMEDFLIKNAKGKHYKTLTEMINNTFNLSLTKIQVKSKCISLKIKTGKATQILPIGSEAIIQDYTYVKISALLGI